jgi:type II secretory pathway pseudopilin PulG
LKSVRRQEGMSGFFVAIVLLLVAAGIIAATALFNQSASVDRSSQTTDRLAGVQRALELFASANGRLPCPANPAIDSGDEVRNALDGTCAAATDVAAGTVPWKALGIRRDDSLDAWGMKISYRTYTGTQGSLTQDNGVSMVDCDTNEALPQSKTPVTGRTNGLCRPSHDTREDAFLAGKGLAVTDFGNAITDAAYVLISHGSTGLGAFSSDGIQKLPLPANGPELANITNASATTPFVAMAASALTVAPELAAHFDDVLAYRRLDEFVKKANLGARDWPDTVLASGKFDTATLTAALGSAPPQGDIGRQSIDIYNARVTGFNSSGNQDLTFNLTNGNEGIGGAGSGGNSLSGAAGEGVRIELTQATKAARFSVTLNDFGQIFGNWSEQVELKFLNGASIVSTQVKQGCQNDGGLASFTVDVGSDFDTVEVKALTTTQAFGFSFPSQFFVSEFRACLAGAACATTLQTVANTCP